MSQVIYLNATLETLTCWAREGCGVHFAVPLQFKQSCAQHGSTFYCPRGHALSFGEGEVDKLKKQLEAETKRKEWAQTEARNARDRAEKAELSHRLIKGKAKALRERIKNGVCPCCKRHFTNLERHMDTKHPGFATEPEASP
jgi:Zn-finger nucleic acid-binding protein